MSNHRLSRHIPVTHAATSAGRFGALRSATAFLMAAGLFVTSTAGFIYRDISQQVANSSIDASDFLKDPSGAEASSHLPGDAFEGRAINVLIANIDSRYDQGSDEYGDVDEVATIHTDATMVAHISADRTRIQFVSIPRDLVTDIPSCIDANGEDTDAYEGMFNTSFTTGAITDNTAAGIACTQRATERLTGLDIDAFVLTDFRGFTGMVDALGGVWYYIPEDIDDDGATLYISEGCYKLDGTTALRYARARYSLGDGSDISRIGRQQKLVAAMLRELFSKNFVTELPSVLAFVKSSLSAVKTSPNLADLNTDMGLLLSLSKIDRSGIQLMTMPIMPHPDDEDRVAAREPEAEAIWRSLRNDKPFPVGATFTDGNGQEVTVPAPDDALPQSSSSTPNQVAESPYPNVEPANEGNNGHTVGGDSVDSELPPAPPIPECPPKS